jgi:uncharacterized protein YbjQ (UPF0145 family)
MPLPTPEFMTTTANFLDGYRTVRTFGVGRGITVRSRSVFGTIGAAFQQLRGGEVSLLTELCERTRHDAFSLAIEHARDLGANALIALRYDATEIMSGVSEVLCYGTAVRVVPARDTDAAT